MSTRRSAIASASAIEKATSVFRQAGGTLRTREALRAGIHPRTLYAMRAAGLIEPLSRGLFRLATLPPLGNPDLVTVALRVPRGVICLISALAFHEITTQIPHAVDIALSRTDRKPRLRYPPTRVFRFSDRAINAGIETHKIDGTPVRIYDIEKTLADCFKFRNKIGLETALEALRLYRNRKRLNVEQLLHHAGIDRVTNVMRPYLEALL